MSVETPRVPPSPGVAARRKGPKAPPKLPLSAFSPPNTGTSDKFPLPPSPSTVHPDVIIDAHVSVPATYLAQWKQSAGEHLGGQSGGVVLTLKSNDQAQVDQALHLQGSGTSDPPVLSYLLPYTPETASVQSQIPVGYTVAFTENTADSVNSLKEVLKTGRTVDIDVSVDLKDGEAGWEALEDYLTKATEDGPSSKLVLCSVLPPPHDLTLPLVKLLTHPSYNTYQSRCAALSLFPNAYVKFLPPSWDAPTPPTPPPTADPQATQDSKEKKEWKRRIKMYLGPALEAFGFERIIFGTSPASGSTAQSSAGDWYELARESFAELGVEQEAIDAVFGGNAKQVYGKA
ncbi:hypothetical protein PUNSTDRAFT_63316 [Punctularia strigosozonata HHB-11173 SS5]|uniref:uncharacterized protein n=1 Tax=Punctularia strigosozonata (strain HHB-11173) TaxID=741275 RepID=UPI0004418225|nr:uncharacterized protein PUNSTDRAFT_63316 [Punctularia strigosozonata HHB-11173 SS5]EIN12050.1 hypothetical protein PUNSTDRAFT_63316 [Punctularia strigosozonata HHB-11173 SS5]